MLNFSVGKDLAVTALVFTGECYVTHVAVHPSTTDGSIVIKNGTSASGVISFKANVKANAGTQFFSFDSPLRCGDGVYIELTTATATIGYFE